ncbi:PTS system, lactose/cellobiose family IIC component [Lachnospiraceae bacterium 28-4]|nr:PTS system, lactose/cellobiose family IIC component [Lachnospiraceae bacterium 28-4]
MSFYGKLQEWLAGPFTQKMQKFMQNPYMRALQTCFSTILPMIMVGSLASLINTFRNFWDWIPDLSLINSFSFGLISLFMAFLIPYSVMESKKLHKQKMITGFASISALVALANPQFVDGNLVVNSGYVGTGGMTVALVLGLVIGAIFSTYFKHGLFKKNTSLPSVVVVWFESILIVFLLILACMFIGQHFDLFSLLEVVFAPLANIGNTYLGFVLLYMIMALCYCCGLSAWAVWPIACALYLTNIAANAAAVAAGQPPIYIATDEVVFMGWCCLGGMGCTLPLNILMLRSKSKKINTIGKAAIASSIFNINEPVMYGLPVVLNPVMMLGFMVVSFIIPTVTYIVFKLGLVAIPAVAMMMNFLPQPISTFMVNSDFKGIILWALLFVLAYFVYLPFFKAYEKQEIEREQEEAQEEA